MSSSSSTHSGLGSNSGRPAGDLTSGPRIGLRPLAQLLRRVGVSYRNGIDGRRIWDLEAQSGPRPQRAAFTHLRARIGAGDTLTEAMRSCRGVFPPLVVEMVELGEHTGKLDSVLLRLADHYEHVMELRRNFLIGIAWPAIQLFMCVMIVGLLIWIFGWISQRNEGQTIDPLGFGLVGTSGLAIYFGGVFFLVAAVTFVVIAFQQGWLGSSLNRMIVHLPVLGNCLRVNSLARFCWTLSLSLEAGSDARRALRMSLRSTQLPYYMESQAQADSVIERGGEFHEALRATERFPDDFILSLASAEHAGAITDSLDAMSRDYAERARSANRMLTYAATFTIWVGVAALIIFLIFRLFMFYLGMINDALNFK